MPKNETFPVPSGFAHVPLGDMTHNYTFKGADDIQVLPQNMTNSSWPLGPFSSRTYYNVSSSAISTGDFDTIIGKVTYVESNESLPAEQEFVVFMIEEAEGCEDKLDNITNATGVILIHNETTRYEAENLTNRSFNAVRVNSSVTNLTNVTEELKNGTLMFADNILDNKIITFTECLIPDWWPDYNFFIIYDNIKKSEWVLKAGFVWGINNFLNPQYKCKGIIIHDYIPDVHEMLWHNRDWFRIGMNPNPDKNKYAIPFYALPMFLINMSVGEWLVNNSDDSNTTIVGYLNQEFKKEKHKPIYDPEQWTVGVEAYNVIGNITIDKSPDDNIVIISNRYDGWWGECPGDSGLGGGMVLAIAKYFKDNNIKPKYNLTFLMTTGEELGFRGAQHYSDSHEDDNITFWIGLDQLGQDVEGSKLVIDLKYESTNKTVWAILNETKYKERSYDRYENKTWVTIDGGGGTEASVWKQRTGTDCKTVCFHKNSVWDYHHRAGLDYTRGDVLKGIVPDEGIDRDDANLTLELVWNITKYFLVDPDCWFSNVSYEAIDSPNDGDTLPDSIRANFTINTILPHDKVMAKIFYSIHWDGGSSSWIDYKSVNYTVTSEGKNETIIFEIPDDANKGNYSIRLRLYNSTGRINEIVGIGTDNYNDSNSSEVFPLCHPFGYVKEGASEQSVYNRITGSVFTANEYGVADNITALVFSPDSNPPIDVISKCMIYRKNDSKLIGTTDEVDPGGTPVGGEWKTYPFSNPKPVLVKDTEYVLTCWSNDSCSLYYDSFATSKGRFNDTLSYGTPPQYINFTNESRTYSIYCSYTPDNTPLEITNVSNTPNTVGFGFNVTISANVTDNISGIDTVDVNITYPDNTTGNYTMNNTVNDTYEYVFSDTWLVGQYNYTIWAVDNSNNTNSSTGHSFNVSAQATISIATLKDSYGNDEYINITDPPTPPDDYYLVNRGLTWNEYYNATSGNNVLEAYAGPINYQDENDEWMPINCTINQLESDHPAYMYGYRAGNERGIYNIYFKSNIQDTYPVAFAYNKSTDSVAHVVRSKLVGVGYLDPTQDWAYEYLQNVQSSQGQINDCSATYESVFTGTDVVWTYGNSGLKEEIIMSNTTKTLLQAHPPSDYGLSNQESYLVFITKLDYHNLQLYDSSGLLTGNITVSDRRIDFKDALGRFKCALPIGEAYELNNESARHRLIYRVVQYNGNYYLLSGLKASDLNDMMFPVVVDPTLTVYSTSSDGYIRNYSTNYNTAWSASTGIVKDSVTTISIGQRKAFEIPPSYNIYRGFLFFNTSAIPLNAIIDSATLSLYKKSDFSSTDFDIVIQNGQPTYPHDPLQSGDYNKNHYSGNGGSLNTSNFSNGYNDISLTNYSWINTDGTTKFCLRSSRDINGTAPTASEYVTVYSSESSIESTQPKLVIEYRNQSKIKNTGSTDIKGYLLIQVQFYNREEWVVADDTVNESSPRTIKWDVPKGQEGQNILALDTIFNGLVNTEELSEFGSGTYRVYAAFRDPEGNILKCDDETQLVATYEFTITFA